MSEASRPRVPIPPTPAHDRHKALAPGTTFRQRWCEHCGRGMCQTIDGAGVPDACLGLIPGVSHACCGHGTTDQAYVVLGGEPNQAANEVRNLTLRGQVAINFFNLMRLGEVEEPYGLASLGPPPSSSPRSMATTPRQASTETPPQRQTP